jgi:predicted amidophosphoribosyltransferase
MDAIIDRDPGDEDYGKHEGGGSTGLCTFCGDDAALPNDDICESCLREILPDEDRWEQKLEDVA